MKLLAAFVIAGLCATAAVAQNPTPAENTSSDASVAGGTVVNAALNSSIDSKKAKAGDPVVAHTTEAVKSADGRTVLPNGTKLIGHVTKASARSNGQGEAMLALQFEKAVLKDKQEMPLNVVIQAVAAPTQAASTFSSDTERTTSPGSAGMPSSNPSMSGSRGARQEGASPAPQQYPNGSASGSSTGEANSAGPLPANSRGVYGLQDVQMNPNATGEGTVLTSTGKNVHLDGGTRLLLAVQPQSASATPGGK
jgi:hypothetical protein